MYKTRFARLLHVSSTSRHLVGPNDPVSNLRPIIYTDIPGSPRPSISHSHALAQPEPHLNHPYSLNEFADLDSDVSCNRTLELQYKLAREQLDVFNHNYWIESNTRFESARESVLTSLPESASPETRENALSGFYKKWVMQEKTRQDEYANEWRKQNWNTILLAARVEYQRFKQRIL